MKMKRLGVLMLFVLWCICFVAPVEAEEGLNTLESWIKEAFTNNLEYQLELESYQLSLKENYIYDKWGIRNVDVLLPSVVLKNGELNIPKSIGLSYRGVLLDGVTVSGSSAIMYRQDQKFDFSSGLGINLDIMDLIFPRLDQRKKGQLYLEQRMNDVKYNLASAVVSQYISILKNGYEERLAEVKVELSVIGLNKVKEQHAAGVVSLMDLYAAEDEYRDAKKALSRVQKESHRLEDELRLLSGIDIENLELAPLKELDLEVGGIKEFIESWQDEKVDSYVTGINQYEMAKFAVEEASYYLRDKKLSIWQISADSSFRYQFHGKPELQVTLGFSPTLYNAFRKLDLKGAELEVKRQELELRQLMQRLSLDIITHVNKIQEAEEVYEESVADLQESYKRREQVKLQLEKGFATAADLLTMDKYVIERELAVLRAKEQWIVGEMSLARMLGYNIF